MGYCAATPICSDKAQAKMVEFLQQHYRPWNALARQYPKLQMLNDPTEQWKEGPLSYDHRLRRIGFQYSVLYYADHYVFCFLHWIALQVGRRRIFRATQVPEAIPYIVYDGGEAWPVILKSRWASVVPTDDSRWPLVNDNGFHPASRSWENWNDDAVKEMGKTNWFKAEQERYNITDQLVEKELQRLTGLWNQTRSR